MSTISSSIAAHRGFENSKRSTALSLVGMLGAILFFAAMITTTFDFVHAKEGTNFGVNFQTLFRLGACAVFGLYGCIYLPVTKAEFLRFPGAWGTLILAWAMVTVPFSVAPLYSMAAVFSLACVTLFVPAAMSQLGGLRTVQSLLVGLLFFVALNWVVHFTVPSLAQSAFVMPNGEVVYRFGNDSQQLGLQIAWSLGFMLLLTFGRFHTWRIAALPIVVLVATLPLTQSRTASLASLTAVGIATWLYLSARGRVLAIAAGFVALAVVLFAAAFGVEFTSEFDRLARSISRSGQIEELKNFTGRVQIWEYVWNRCEDSPLFGYGYGASRFALQEDPNYPLNFPADHAHNLYLNTALTMGLPGLALLVAMIGHMFVRILWWRSKVVCVVLGVVLVASITEVILYGPMPRSHTYIWLVALFWQQMGMDAGVESTVTIRGVEA